MKSRPLCSEEDKKYSQDQKKKQTTPQHKTLPNQNTEKSLGIV